MAQVTDYDVANAAGNVVRQDINDIFDAIKTLNAGQQNNLGTTSPCQLFADTQNNKLKIRSTSGDNAAASATFFEIGDLDTANLGLLKASGGAMSGVLELDNSNSASTPALCFDGDEDTGLFRNAANIMGFSSGGTEQMIFDANGITLRNEKAVRFSEAIANGSNYIALKAAASVASNKTITLPDETGTLLTSASSISNSNLANSSVTVGTTAISLGASATTLAGISSLTATTINATTLNITNTQTTNIQDASGANGSTAVQIQQGRAKAWVNFNGQSGGSNKTIRDDFNVSSVTDIATGDFRVNFDTSMPSVNYCVAMAHKEDESTSGGSGARPLIRRTSDSMQTGSVRTTLANVSSGAGVDPLVFTVVIYGD